MQVPLTPRTDAQRAAYVADMRRLLHEAGGELPISKLKAQLKRCGWETGLLEPFRAQLVAAGWPMQQRPNPRWKNQIATYVRTI